jgi:hypothetical protein
VFVWSARALRKVRDHSKRILGKTASRGALFCAPYQILFASLNRGRWNGQSM